MLFYRSRIPPQLSDTSWARALMWSTGNYQTLDAAKKERMDLDRKCEWEFWMQERSGRQNHRQLCKETLQHEHQGTGESKSKTNCDQVFRRFNLQGSTTWLASTSAGWKPPALWKTSFSTTPSLVCSGETTRCSVKLAVTTVSGPFTSG